MMISFKLDGSDVTNDFNRRLNKARNSQNLMRPIAADLENSTEQNFKAQGRQPRWQRLKAKTLKAKGGSGRILQGPGTPNLRNKIQSTYNRNTATIGTNVPYARIHQKGGKAGRNHSATIPARPFLKLTRREIRNIMKWIRKYFA